MPCLISSAGGEGAVLLSDWERMTPLWYNAVGAPESGPAQPTTRLNCLHRPPPGWRGVLLPSCPADRSPPQPATEIGRRLPAAALYSHFYRVVEPGDSSIPPELTRLARPGTNLQLVAYQLPGVPVTAGDYVPLTLGHERAPSPLTDYFVPVLTVGDPAGAG